MKTILKAGLVLAVLVEIWTYFIGFTGWYKDPVLQNAFWVVILIEIGVLIWGLRLTSREGRGYGAQLGAGTLISVVAALLIFIGSYLFTEVVFPNYFTEINEVYRQMLVQQGLSQEQIEAQIASMAPMQNSLTSALMGAVMTVVTGFLASLVIAAFVRHRPEVAKPG